MNSVDKINHPTLGKLVVCGLSLHTEKEVEYRTYYTEKGFFVAVPATTDILEVEVDMSAVESVDYYKNHDAIVQHYKGGKYIINGNAYDPVDDTVLVDYSEVYTGSKVKEYLRPSTMFYDTVTVTVPRFSEIKE